MGVILNPGASAFLSARRLNIYVDKSDMISRIIPFVGTADKYLCVSRPRRFGKSFMANMLSAYFDNTVDGHEAFKGLKVTSEPSFETCLNKFYVVKLNMQNFISESEDIKEMIELLKRSVMWDLKKVFPDVSYFDENNLGRSFADIYDATGNTFVFIIDEWDSIFREFKTDFAAQKKYLDFLRDLLKDRDYVEFAYMTGILPIKKYGSQSALNMFKEISMESPGIFAEYTGFTNDEVLKLCESHNMDMEACRLWYDGYSFPNCEHIYNPRSLVEAMNNAAFADYWNKTETYEALRAYIDMNFDGLKDSIIKMMAGSRERVNTGSFQNDMTTFSNKDDVLTLLIHLGYLGYDKEKSEVFIPNKELMMEFVTSTTAGIPWKEVANSVSESRELLKSTWAMKEKDVAAGLEKAHLETSHLQYNDENALSYTISLAYYAARDYYSIVREMPAGIGFADMVFIPRKNSVDKPAMIVELKWDKSVDTAIKQICNKHYPDVLKKFTGDILLVGINYDKKTKKHECRIERLKKIKRGLTGSFLSGIVRAKERLNDYLIIKD